MVHFWKRVMLSVNKEDLCLRRRIHKSEAIKYSLFVFLNKFQRLQEFNSLQCFLLDCLGIIATSAINTHSTRNSTSQRHILRWGKSIDIDTLCTIFLASLQELFVHSLLSSWEEIVPLSMPCERTFFVKKESLLSC
jgi:hypothetical protein